MTKTLMFQVYFDRDKQQVRIGIGSGADLRDVCGAVDEITGFEQARILNKMRKLPEQSDTYWKRDVRPK